jgi:hypothetical protein
MRKVMYQVWIPRKTQPIAGGTTGMETVPGTSCFSEPKSGLFHGWGYESQEDANSMVMDSIAIVEDITTGVVYNVPPTKVRFVQPPETRVHKNEKLCTVSDMGKMNAYKRAIDALLSRVDSSIDRRTFTIDSRINMLLNAGFSYDDDKEGYYKDEVSISVDWMVQMADIEWVKVIEKLGL